MHAVEIKDIYKTFLGKKVTRVDALKGVSLTIEKGEVFGFLGPNGAGKTTTIKILIGLIKPSSGQASIMGHDSGSYRSRKKVGYLPENPSFYDFLTGREYLAFVAKTFGMNDTQVAEQTEKILKLLDLQTAQYRPIRGYSKGMVQRLGIAQALIHDPEVYIFDEPMSGLDPIGRALVKEIILDLKKKGKCVFFSTHITADVETVCDRVGIIVNGALQRVAMVGSILNEGIIGYYLRIQESKSSEHKEVYVNKDELSKFIAAIQKSGQEISSIEPKRKNLEDFFLDVVKEGKC
jgi:ABC-2 type transport system ATP-binding protein